MLIIKVEAGGNTSAFGADGADVVLISKMSGSFLKQRDQTFVTCTHIYTPLRTRRYLRKAVCSEFISRVCACVSKTQTLIKVCEEKKKTDIDF